MHHKIHLKEFLLLSIIIVFLVFSAKFGNGIDFRQILEIFKNNPILAAVFYLLYYIVSSMVITLPIVPIWPIVLLIFPFWLAFALSWTGTVIGAAIDFFLARKFGKPFATKMMGEKLFEEIKHLIDVSDQKTFILVRLFGNNYFDPISYIAGLSHMPFKKYILTTICTSGLWLFAMLSLINHMGGLDNIKGILTIMGVYGGFILIGTIIWELFHRSHVSAPK